MEHSLKCLKQAFKRSIKGEKEQKRPKISLIIPIYGLSRNQRCS